MRNVRQPQLFQYTFKWSPRKIRGRKQNIQKNEGHIFSKFDENYKCAVSRISTNPKHTEGEENDTKDYYNQIVSKKWNNENLKGIQRKKKRRIICGGKRIPSDLSEAMQAKTQWNNNFKVLKKNTCQPRILCIPRENTFQVIFSSQNIPQSHWQNKGIFIHKKAEKVHSHKISTIKNIKGNSSSKRCDVKILQAKR